jgi:putative transposase
MVRKRKRKRIALAERLVRAAPTAPNQSGSMDYVADALIDGRKLRALTIVDDFTRECLAIEVDTSLPASRVVAVLERLRDLRGLPSSITVDHGPEFGGRVLDAWAYQSGVDLAFIRPGKPVDNCYIESFNGRLRDECLNEHWFVTMAHACAVIEAWRIEYNTERTHSSLRNQTPQEFRDAHASEVKRLGSVSVKTENPVSLTPDSTSIPYQIGGHVKRSQAAAGARNREREAEEAASRSASRCGGAQGCRQVKPPKLLFLSGRAGAKPQNIVRRHKVIRPIFKHVSLCENNHVLVPRHIRPKAIDYPQIQSPDEANEETPIVVDGLRGIFNLEIQTVLGWRKWRKPVSVEEEPRATDNAFFRNHVPHLLKIEKRLIFVEMRKYRVCIDE